MAQDQVSMRKSFDRDGFVFPLRAMAGGQAQAYRDELEKSEAAAAGDPVKTKAVRSYCNLVLPFVDEITRLPAVTEPVSEILGDDLLVFGCSFFTKEANSSSFVSWHQDLHYWGLKDDDEVTAWIALSPATPESGCMRFVAGSHRTILDHSDTFAEDNLLTRGQEIAVEVDESEAIDVVLSPGEMSLHHGRLLHASNPNRSNDRRIGVAIRYITPRQFQVTGGKTLATLVRGNDPCGNFELAPPPQSAMGENEMSLWRKATSAKDEILYRETV